MPVIHLVRHGQASFGSDDYDVLSPTGRQQAALAGRELGHRPPGERVGLLSPVEVGGGLTVEDHEQLGRGEVAVAIGVVGQHGDRDRRPGVGIPLHTPDRD